MGVELEAAVQANPSHDGIPIPAVVRRAMDVVSNHGLKEEGIYRVSAARSKVEGLRGAANEKGDLGRLEAGPDGVHAAAGFLKLFLRSLPSHLLTQTLLPQLEKAAGDCPCRGESAYCRCLAGDRVAALLRRLPPPNYFLTAYTFLHFRQVIKHERYNKMNLVSVGLIIEPMLRVSQRLLALLLRNAHADHPQATPLFKDVKLKRYPIILPAALTQQHQDHQEQHRGDGKQAKKSAALGGVVVCVAVGLKLNASLLLVVGDGLVVLVDGSVAG